MKSALRGQGQNWGWARDFSNNEKNSSFAGEEEEEGQFVQERSHPWGTLVLSGVRTELRLCLMAL